MTRGGLLLFALVSGGDYDEVSEGAILQSYAWEPESSTAGAQELRGSDRALPREIGFRR